MSKQYFHISSAFRDRNVYPNQGDFITGFTNECAITTPLFAKDPVVNSYPIFGFDFSTIPIGPLALVLGTNSDLQIQPPVAPPSGYDIGSNFFVGMQMTFSLVNFTATITSYDSAINVVSISPILPWTWSPSFGTYTISFPVYVNSSHILIPYGNSNTGAYVDYILEDITIGEYRTITAYDGTTYIATLDSAFGAGWNNTDTYLLRPSIPIIYNQSVTSVGNYTYLGKSYFYVELGGTISSVENTYNNNYFFDSTLYANGDPNYAIIVKYFGNNPPTGSGLPNNVALLSTELDSVALDTYDILPFTRDNYHSLEYFGSVVSSDELSCYEIELVSLILPNVVLNTTGVGGRAINVPYVYIEFYNVNNGAHNLVYSNNPNAVNALFFVSLNDYPQIFNSPYVRVNGGQPVQTIKFKPNDSFRIRIRMPNGDIFSTSESDNASPLAPNTSLQIELFVSIRKVK